MIINEAIFVKFKCDLVCWLKGSVYVVCDNFEEKKKRHNY